LVRRTTLWIAASVGVALLGLSGFGIVLWRSVHVDQADAADARRRFEEIRHDFPSAPLIAWDAGGRLTRNAPRAARGPRPSQLHVLVYRLREERLVQADAPLWFYKIKGSAVNYALRGTGFDLAALGLTAVNHTMAGSLARSTGRLALVAVSVSAFAGAPVQVRHASIPFRIVAEGVDSRIDAHRELIIRMPGVWDFVWHKHSNSVPPAIDFRREIVIAIFGGRQSTPERALLISGVSEEDGSIVVRYREVNDRTRREVPGAPTAPFVIVAMPQRRPPVRFVKELE
jgi:hypothetical protein